MPLQRRGTFAEGRFDSTFGSFMGIRRSGETYQSARPTSQQRDSARRRTTTLHLTRPWEYSPFWFFAHTMLPPGTSFSLRGDAFDQPPRNTVLHASDGSWSTLGQGHVRIAHHDLLWSLRRGTSQIWVVAIPVLALFRSEWLFRGWGRIANRSRMGSTTWSMSCGTPATTHCCHGLQSSGWRAAPHELTPLGDMRSWWTLLTPERFAVIRAGIECGSPDIGGPF